MTSREQLQHDQELFFANGGRATICPPFQPRPLLESKRTLPADIKARQKLREKKKIGGSHRRTIIGEGYLSAAHVQKEFGLTTTGGAHRRFLKRIEEGLYPPPDVIKYDDKGTVYRGWLQQTVDDWKNMQSTRRQAVTK